ncbi:sensor histidine kinase [Mobilicoccus pelagius]|uniref:histidine kinase n=1 Tax=Mobilicoccus pelagius NBRC 104925 TaxID=1089455 RepID=H5UW61_9MICO|nr:HAMP domain-containing sensor histidine kinase [Mobilicoccus pelagius]GAB49969.1 putative two-component histidine kinase [Mobilicoccus pelagius NBRC 104925]
MSTTLTGVVVDSTPGPADGPSGSGPRRGPFRGWTLRRTLVVSILTLFALVTLATGFGMSTLLERSLVAELDGRVASTAARVLGPGGGPGGHRPEPASPGQGRPLSDMLVVVVDGSTVETNTVATRDGGSRSLAMPQVEALLQAGLTSRPSTVDLGDPLGPYRVVAVTTDRGERVVTGLPMQPLYDAVRQMRLITAGLGLLGFLLVGVGTACLVSRALRPLDRVAATATRVATLPLSSGEVELVERVPSRDTDRRTEVGQVGAALNDLLDHVDVALRHRQESETTLRRFVADASHELRTPLASIRGYTELSLRDDRLPGEVRGSLRRVESESARMAALVEDLLLLARLDAGRDLTHEPVDLTMLLVETVNDARVVGPDHVWRLDLPEEPVEVTGDRARLTQVLVNLLANARLHTPPGTTVTGGLRAESGGAVLTICDDGPGIDPEMLPTIFSRFARGDTARTREGGSTGLGLSIVEAVTTAHGGTVDVESRPGRTCFTLRLPRGS